MQSKNCPPAGKNVVDFALYAENRKAAKSTWTGYDLGQDDRTVVHAMVQVQHILCTECECSEFNIIRRVGAEKFQVACADCGLLL